jgi:hypothetical protein
LLSHCITPDPGLAGTGSLEKAAFATRSGPLETVKSKAGTRLCCSEFSIYLYGSPFELSEMQQLLLSTLAACPGCPKRWGIQELGASIALVCR